MNQGKYGLKQKDIAEIIRQINKFPQIEVVYLFGSRAKGNFKDGSDVDIAISGDKIDYSVVSGLSYALNEETVLSYFFDVIHYETIDSESLLQHVKEYGINLMQNNG